MTSTRAVVVVAALVVGLAVAVFLVRGRGGGEGGAAGPESSGSSASEADSAGKGLRTATVPPGTPDPVRITFPGHLQNLRQQYLDAAARRDFDALHELGQQMKEKSQGKHEEMSVLALISSTLDQLSRERRSDGHAPRRQTLTAEEIRASLGELDHLLSQARETQDPVRRHLLFGKLLRGRVPDELFPEVAALVERCLSRSPPEPGVLRLLNSFASSASMDPLLKYAGAEFAKDVRAEALRVLMDRRLPPEAIQAVLEMAKVERDPDVRAGLITLIGDRGGAQADGLLRGALTDGYPPVRIAVAGALDPSLVAHRESLFGLLADSDAAVRQASLTRLSRCVGEADVLPRVLQAARSDASEDVRLQAIHLLQRAAFRTNEQVLATLNALAADPSPEVRARAHSAFKTLTGP